MYYVVLSTTSSREEARRIADKLVSQSVAACVNIIKDVESIYRWQGKIERCGEFLLIIKTNKKNLKKVFRLITEVHSYEVPEVVALKIDQGNEKYLNWIDTSLK